MKQYAFSDTKWTRCLLALLILALLALNRDTMYGQVLLGFYPSQILLLAIVGLTGIAFLVCRRKDLKEIFRDPRIAAAIGAAVLFLLPMAVKRDWQLMYGSVLFCILTAILISFFMDLERASRYYVVILSVLGLYSVIATYFLRILPDRGILQVPVFVNSTGYEFYQFGLANVSLDFVSTRNFGIFREPGAYQFFLILGIYLNNDVIHWEKSWQLWTVNAILGITVLSTFATGGIIELGLLAVFFFFDKKWYKDRKMQILAGVLILAVAAVIAWILITKNSLYLSLIGIFGKFFDGTESGSARLGAMGTDLQMFFRHPIFGEKLSTVLHAVVDNTTSTLIQYAAFGIVAGSLHVLAWVVLAWDRKRNFFANCLVLLVLFMSFNTQNLITNPVFWLFPILALVERGIPAIMRRRKGE